MSDVLTGFKLEDDGRIIVRRQQDVAAIVDDAKARANEGLHGHKDMKHKMRVPNVVVEHYCNTWGITLREFINNPEHAKRMFNSPEFADLRIAPGRM